MSDKINNCMVCFEVTTYKTIPCTHPICSKCLFIWLKKSRKCPMCRCHTYNFIYANDIDTTAYDMIPYSQNGIKI